VLSGAVVGQVLAASAIVVLDSLHVGLFGVLVPLWVFITCCGFSFPCQQVLALANHPAEAGTAASLMGAINFGLAGLLSPIVGLFGIHNAVPMGSMMICTASVSILVMTLVVRPWSVPPLAR
jgi:DHA1 family bicyclomycin/chloramphenicol resistance-like MFS transporter